MAKRKIIGKTTRIQKGIKYVWLGKGSTPSGWLNYNMYINSIRKKPKKRRKKQRSKTWKLINEQSRARK